MSTPITQSKRKCSYTIKFKKNVINHALACGSKYKTSRVFNISRSNIIRWCKLDDDILNNEFVTQNTRRIAFKSTETRRNVAQNSECEQIVYDWFKEQRVKKLGVSTLSLRNKMNSEMINKNITDKIKPTNSWLQRFMARYGLSLRRISGSGRSFPSDLKEILNTYFTDLQEIIAREKYKSHQIFNFDESFFRMDCPSAYTVSHIGARKTNSKSTGKEKAKFIFYL